MSLLFLLLNKFQDVKLTIFLIFHIINICTGTAWQTARQITAIRQIKIQTLKCGKIASG